MLKLKQEKDFTVDAKIMAAHGDFLEIKSDSLTHLHFAPKLIVTPKKLALYCPSLQQISPDVWSFPELSLLTLKGHGGKLKDFFPETAPKKPAPLSILRIAGMGLMEVPAWLSCFSQLKELDLNGNRLTDLPLEFIKLTQLVRINLENNQLNKIPVALTRMSWINHLALDGNQLSESELKLAFQLWGIWF